MNQDLQLRYIIKQRIKTYNDRQKSLYINTFVFRGVLIIVFIVILIILAFFIFPIFTPFMLAKGILSDVIAISTSTCIVSIIVSIFFLLFAKNKWNKLKQNNLNKQKLLEENYPEKIDIDSIETENISLQVKPKLKSNFINKFLSLLNIIKDLFEIFFAILFSPVTKPKNIYFDENKLSFACNLINHLCQQKNNLIDYETITNKYTNFSNTWLFNALESLEIIDIIKIVTSESNQKVILLSLDITEYNIN